MITAKDAHYNADPSIFKSFSDLILDKIEYEIRNAIHWQINYINFLFPEMMVPEKGKLFTEESNLFDTVILKLLKNDYSITIIENFHKTPISNLAEVLREMIPEDQRIVAEDPEDLDIFGNRAVYVKTCVINISWEDPNKVTLKDERKDKEELK